MAQRRVMTRSRRQADAYAIDARSRRLRLGVKQRRLIGLDHSSAWSRPSGVEAPAPGIKQC